MYRTEKEGTEAPELESFFSMLSNRSALNYCVVCLRTDQERKLIKNETFKTFASAVKLENDWQNHLICYMCERQAANALKFFKAAAYASALHKIFKEVMLLKQSCRRMMFQRHNFKKIVAKFELDHDKPLPSDWENELLYIRSITKLNETKTLVVDNKGAKVNITPTILNNPSEVYVIPDDPPDTYGQVTATAVRYSKKIQQPDTTNVDKRPAGRTRPCPKRFQVNSDTSRKTPDTTECQPDSLHEPEIELTNDSFALRSDNPKVSETLVILDDDEDKDPLQIRIEKVKSESESPFLENLLTHPHRTTPVSTATPFLTVTPGSTVNPITTVSTTPVNNTPKLVPIEKLLEKPNVPQNGIIMTNDPNFVLHPIILTGGMLTVPTLSANIVDGQLVYQNQGQQNTIVPFETRTLKDLINAPFKEMNPMLTSEVHCQTNALNLTSNLKSAKPSEIVSKTTKRDNNDMFTLPSKKIKGLPVIESVTSEAVKSDRIDWEDKIPMDVISFVDAVDPNPIITDANTSSSIGLAPVSQAQATQTSLTSINKNSEVIDLC